MINPAKSSNAATLRRIAWAARVTPLARLGTSDHFARAAISRMTTRLLGISNAAHAVTKYSTHSRSSVSSRFM